MNAWANIEISSRDSEIIAIDALEKTLGQIPAHVKQIRQLITRFEVCHFKVRTHLKHIQVSISKLHPAVDPDQIGEYHIHKNNNAWKNDKTGRSQLGQQYLQALNGWLDDDQHSTRDHDTKTCIGKIKTWLGIKTQDKIRLVRLLVARLTWDWESLDKYQEGGKWEHLEFQICRMDICHYAFPEHLDLLIKGIGALKPAKIFKGCGSYNSDIRKLITEAFSGLSDKLQKNRSSDDIDQNHHVLLKTWLTACFAKTLKEQIGLKKLVPGITTGS